MKKATLLVLMVAGLNFLGHAQEAKPAPVNIGEVKAVENPNAAEMTFSFETYDYGTIKQGADGGSEFKFKNTGKEPLIITEARGSCGCTVPTYPKEPIMKGETGVIKVHYDTKRVGAFTKTVTITSNAKTPSKVITIKGVVEAAPDESTDGVPLKKLSGSPMETK